MSNPGVIELVNKKIGNQRLRVEDNIGESIHIHFGRLRLDFCIHEFIELVDALNIIMEKMISVDGFLICEYDAIFLSQCCNRLLNLESVAYKNVLVGNLLTESNNKGYISLANIQNSDFSQALRGNKENLDIRVQKNYFGDTNRSRLQNIYDSIRMNGYPYKNHYIVTCDDGFYIIDGCHRASCIYDIYGDIEIPIVCWYSRGKRYTDDEKRKALLERQMIEKLKEYKIKEKKNHIEKRKKLVYKLLLKDLEGKRVAIKGAGLHTQELIKLMNGKINFVFIVANDIKMSDRTAGIPIRREFKPQDVDVIIISSFKYRDQMKMELLEYQDKVEIYDIYSQGIDHEFYK